MKPIKFPYAFIISLIAISLLGFTSIHAQENNPTNDSKVPITVTKELETITSESEKIQETAYIFWNRFSSGETLFDIGLLFDNIFENTSLTDVVIFSIGMVIYGIFIWHFYQLIARRDIISIGDKKTKTGARVASVAAYILKYIIIFPLIIFVWFFVYSMFMFFLAPDVEIKFVFMIVISLVIAIRISAYYKEDLARDLAKMIPFAILAIFLSTGVFFSLDQLKERISELVPFVLTVFQFVIIAIVVEIILRVIYLIKTRTLGSHKKDLENIIGEKVADKIEDMVEEEVNEKLEEIEPKKNDKKN